MRELSAPLRARRLCSVNALRCVVTLAVCSWFHFTVQHRTSLAQHGGGSLCEAVACGCAVGEPRLIGVLRRSSGGFSATLDTWTVYSSSPLAQCVGRPTLTANRRTLSPYLCRWGISRAMEVALCACIPSKMWARLYTRGNDFSTFIVASVDTSRLSMETLPWVAMVACRLNTSAVSLTTLPKNAARTLDCSERGNRPVGVSQLRDVLLQCYADADSRDVMNVVRRRHRVVAAISAAMFSCD